MTLMEAGARAHPGPHRAGTVLRLTVRDTVEAATKTLKAPWTAVGDIAHLPVGHPDIRCAGHHHGCFEATVSDELWAERAAELSFWDLHTAARLGDTDALTLFVRRSRVIGRAAAHLYDLVRPDELVVDELGAVWFPECLSAIRDEVRDHSRSCRHPEVSVTTPGSALAAAG